MTTTTSTTSTTTAPTTAVAGLPAQRSACPVCGRNHRSGSKAAAACAALTAATTTGIGTATGTGTAPGTSAGPFSVAVEVAVEHLVVTPEHLHDVLAGWDAALSRIDAPGGPLLLVVPAWAAGEVVVDRHDVLVLVEHLGSVAAVAADLSAALAWEATHGALA